VLSSWFSSEPGSTPAGGPAGAVTVVRPLRWRDRAAALAYLRRDPGPNLMLIDQVARLGVLPARGPRSALLAAWEGPRQERLAGILSVRPSVLLDAGAGPAAITTLAPGLDGLAAGLIRSPAAGVDLLWKELERGGRRALVDRYETAYRLDLGPDRGPDPAGTAAEALPPERGLPSVREAREADLEDLVIAARASLREEGRPDPFHGNPAGFRAWVRGRLSRARVVEEDGRVVFVAYADVQRAEGWLLQGVYTWPDRRRRGFARAGVAALAHAARREGADHVQLAVVRGNHAAEALYAGLGFRPFHTLRTILFALD